MRLAAHHHGVCRTGQKTRACMDHSGFRRHVPVALDRDAIHAQKKSATTTVRDSTAKGRAASRRSSIVPLTFSRPLVMNHVTTITRDPVCGMTVKEGSATIAWEQKNVRYLFCAEGCKQQFMEKPDQYSAVPARARRTSLLREFVLAAVLFAVALVIVLAFFSIRRLAEKSSFLEQHSVVVQTATSVPESVAV